MAKVNLKDATKGLVDEASEILEKAAGMRREADFLMDALRRMDAEMNRQKEEEELRRKQQEQLKAQSAHTKAFTMLDEDEKQMMEAAMQEQIDYLTKKLFGRSSEKHITQVEGQMSLFDIFDEAEKEADPSAPEPSPAEDDEVEVIE